MDKRHLGYFCGFRSSYSDVIILPVLVTKKILDRVREIIEGTKCMMQAAACDALSSNESFVVEMEMGGS